MHKLSTKMNLPQLAKEIKMPARTWRKKVHETDFCPAGKQMRVMDVMRLLCQKPSGLQEIAKATDSSERTVYRYLAMMTHLGFDVKISPSGKYFFGECPLCGK